MRAIRSTNTKPEFFVRRLIFSQGFRYRLHDRTLPGKPDLVLKKYKVAIFVHGCFWHQHQNCPRASLPASNIHYWEPKLESNTKRDRQVIQELLNNGWRVLIVWECACKKTCESSIKIRLKNFIIGTDLYSEIERLPSAHS